MSPSPSSGGVFLSKPASESVASLAAAPAPRAIAISIVTPVYACEGCLHQLYERLVAVLPTIVDDFEIIMVNDASPDRAWDVISELAAMDRRVKGVALSRNFGQHAAITAGLDRARGDWVVVMDCDLQDRPEEIVRLFRKAREGYDVVFARRGNRQDSILRRIASRLFYGVLGYLTGTPQDEAIANFGVYSRRAVQAVCSIRESHRYFPALIRWVGFTSTSIDVEHAPRTIGRSSYDFTKTVRLAYRTIINFSDKPLRLTVTLGMWISAAALLCSIGIVVMALQGKFQVLGWASIMVSIWFLSGLMIALIGMVGTYLGRAFDESKKRPIYIVRDELNDQGS
jgi:polyisoprenyl-phosphate glycosyltransferase